MVIGKPIGLFFRSGGGAINWRMASGMPVMACSWVMAISDRACLPKQKDMIADSEKYVRTSVKQRLTSVNHDFTLRQ